MADDLIQLGGNASGSSSSSSVSDCTTSAMEKHKNHGQPQEGEEGGRGHSDENDVSSKQGKLDLVLGKMSTTSLDSVAPESLLEELLGDIRRSRTASLASTPTFVSSEYETDCVRDVGRSEAELQGMGVAQLQAVLDNLEHEVDTVSRLLVRLLHVRDKRAGRLVGQYSNLTSVLRHFAKKNGMEGHSELEFTLHHPNTPELHQQWLTAWTVLSQLPRGIPKHWRKTLWSCLAEYGTRTMDWTSQFHSLFSEYSTPEDDKLGTQIVKDLHRTGNTCFSSEEEHAVLKRVLLAYARHNKKTGYCQGFNILAAFILKVVDFNETMALMILVYMVDYKLPENYFSHTLYALSGDMAVFRHLLKFYLPELALHMETLQKEASGTIQTSYSSDNPPDLTTAYAYEPPLADVFSMQWFLTIFATTLPRKACRRVWDAIFLEGSEYVLYTAVAMLAVMERDLLRASTAADFYSMMSRQSDLLRKGHIISSVEFLQVVYAVKSCTMTSDTLPPNIHELREQYTYNIYPCGVPANEVGGVSERPMAPLPSRGGSFGVETLEGCYDTRKKIPSLTTVKHTHKKKKKKENDINGVTSTAEERVHRAFERDGVRDTTPVSGPIEEQVRYLNKHYYSVARQPSHIRCDMQLTPPIARAYCPQQQKDVNPVPYYTAYAADVPLDVIRQSRIMSGFDQLLKFHEHRRDQFILSFTESPDLHHPLSHHTPLPRGRGKKTGRHRAARENSMLISAHHTT